MSKRISLTDIFIDEKQSKFFIGEDNRFKIYHGQNLEVLYKKEKAKMENDNLVNLGDKVKGEIELPKLDVKKYVGTEVEINSVLEYEGKYGYYIIVRTDPVETITREGKDDIVLQGSRLFGLQEDEQGKIGWGKDTKLGLFLKKMNVQHYKDLVTEKVVLQTQTNKDGVDFLTFN